MDHNSQDLLTVIEEYESMIETLTSQIQFYANEQEILRTEITKVIKENRKLAQTINESLDTKSHTSKVIQQEEIENKLNENLKKQLTLSVQEKDTVVQLWQSALRNVDHLEEELRLFEGRTHRFVPKIEVFKIKQKCESQINDLKEKLSNCLIEKKLILKKLK